MVMSSNVTKRTAKITSNTVIAELWSDIGGNSYIAH